ncbi:MAG: NAD(P)H-dependent oxidoreductase [Stappiaceae bacterium]
MAKGSPMKILLIQGHPDRARGHLCHALADAYLDGARFGGHDVELFECAQHEFPVLRSEADWKEGSDSVPASLQGIQQALIDTDHVVLIYPLWLGTMPALVKALLEQLLRPGVALDYVAGYPKPMLKGKSARIVITMGMPALAYRWYFFAHSLKNLERNILGMVGFKPIRSTLLGMVVNASESKRQKWFTKMRSLGERAI